MNGPKPGTSWVWTYFKTSERDGKAFNVCHANKLEGEELCLKELAVDRSGSTKSMINHLQRKHNMAKPNSQHSGSIPVIPTNGNGNDEDNKDVKPSIKSTPRRKLPRSFEKVDESNLMSAVGNFLVSCGVNYSSLEDQTFVALLEACNPAAKKLIAKPEAMREHILNQLQTAKATLALRFAGTDAFINLTCDAWTSPAGHPMLELVAHWIDNDWSLRSLLIAFVRLDGPHNETNVVEAVHRTLLAYGIQDKIMCITADNISEAALSGGALNKLVNRFHPTHHLIGCMTHAIDAAGQVILTQFQEDDKASTKADQGMSSIAVDVNHIANHQTIIGRLYSLAGRLKTSPEAKEKFLETASLLVEGDPLEVFFDYSPVWHATYYMLEQAIKLRDAINMACAQDVESSKLQITPNEWDKVANLLRILKPLERLTKDLMSTSGCTIMGAVPTFEWLLKRTKRFLTDNSNPELLISTLQMQLILDNYQRKAIQKPVYICGPVLDPRIKLTSVPDQAHSLRGSIVDEVKEIFNDHAKLFDQYQLGHNHVNGEEAGNSSDDDNGPRFSKRRKRFPGFDAEITAYFNGELAEESCDPLQFWKLKAEHFPSLARMAQSYLTVQASTASSSREGINRRSVLAVLEQDLPAEDVEAFTCLKSWIKNGDVHI